MRSLEWFLLLSFVPALLIPFVTGARRRAFVIFAVLLPVLAVVLHIIFEGWRTQMLALYGLAVLNGLFRLPALTGRETRLHRWRGLAGSAFCLLAIAGTGVLAGYLLPVVSLPAPTGPYAVGVVDRELVDESRGRRLMVSVWYPSVQADAPARLMRQPDTTISALADTFGFPAPVLQHMRYTTVSASENAPVLAGNEPFPVLVFSHAMVGLRLQNSSTLQQLASHGYVVVAIDHTDAAAVTVFPDGETRLADMARFGVTGSADDADYAAQVDARVFPVWVADQQFVYDTLEAWADSDTLFAGVLDTSRIGSLGHSFGGATSLEVCRVDARCVAAANLDGGLYGAMLIEPATRPLLLMTSEESSANSEAMSRWTAMIDAAQSDTYWLELSASTHFSFTITQLLSPILIPDNFDPRAGLSTIDAYVIAFFDQAMRGTPAPLLEASADAPDVRWFHPAV